MKILLIKLASLGDVLQATPLVRCLSSSGHEVYFLTFKGHEKLLTNNPHVKHVFTLRQMGFSWTLPWNVAGNLLVFLKLCFSGMDISINLHKKYVLNRLARWMGIKQRFGLLKEGDVPKKSALSDGIVFNQKEHHVLQYLKFAELCEVTTRGTAMEYVPRQRKINLPLSKPYIVLCAGGGQNKWASMPNKIWPKGHFRNLIRILSETLTVILIGGPQDRTLHEDLTRELALPTVLDFTNQLDFDELFYLIQGAKLYLGNDSFLLHFASTTGVPTLGLFGPTKGSLLSPLLQTSFFLQSSQECAGCYDANRSLHSQAYCCPENLCMKSLSVQTVLDQIRAILT